ncbi:MAG: DedA family protein [Myxococcota bacterium]
MVRMLIETSLGYPGLWLVCAGSGIFVPVPEDVPLMMAGSRIASGGWAWGLTLLVAWSGVAVRDVCAWAVGRYLLHWLLAGRLGWIIGPQRIARAEGLIARHGAAAVLMGRFMIGFRAPMFIAAGASGVPLRKFVLTDGLGLLAAIPLTVAVGYRFGAPVAQLAGQLIHRASGVAGLLVLFGVAWLAWRTFTVARQAGAEDRTSEAAERRTG